MRSLFLAFPLMAASAVLAQVQGQQVVHRGDTVPINSPGLNTGDKITIKLSKHMPKSENCPEDITLVPAPVGIQGSGASSVSVAVPLDACFGVYQVTGKQEKPAQPAKQGEQAKEAVTVDLEITSPQFVSIQQKTPSVTAIYPKALFQDNASSVSGFPAYSLSFLGPSSLKKDGDYSLSFANLSECPSAAAPQTGTTANNAQQGDASSSANPSSSAAPAAERTNQPCYTRDTQNSDDGNIKFSVRGATFLKDFAGKQRVSLVQDGAESSAQDLFVVNAAESTPRNYAIAVTAALVVLIYVLLSAGHRGLRPTGGSLLTALFLDEETQTYSLSKCQFYAWTVAAILGYLFFAVARSVIQGSPVFPDIPGGLPGILLFSAGTSVLATGITSTKGSKGAGEVHPTLADFITTGTVVAPERLQFVVWTVVGVFTFLTIVFKSNPLTVSDLPKIPDGFLQLMGISSAGYLAGKLARKPGPVIKPGGASVGRVEPPDYDVQAAAAAPPQQQPAQQQPAQQQPAQQQPAQQQPAQQQPPQQAPAAGKPPVLVINLKGQNLDPNGKIRVDGVSLGDYLYKIEPPPGQAPDPQSGFCNELNVRIFSAADYLFGQHSLSLVNTDSQAADVLYPADGLIIAKVGTGDAPQAGDTAVTGKNFAAGTRYIWYDTTSKPIGQLQNATNITETSLTVGARANANDRLVLVSPVGLRAREKA